MSSIMVIRPAVPVMPALMRTAPAPGVMPAMAGRMAAAGITGALRKRGGDGQHADHQQKDKFNFHMNLIVIHQS